MNGGNTRDNVVIGTGQSAIPSGWRGGHREVICLACGRKFLQREFAPGKWTGRACVGCGSGNLEMIVADGNGHLLAGGPVGDGEVGETMYAESLRAPGGLSGCEKEQGA